MDNAEVAEKPADTKNGTSKHKPGRKSINKKKTKASNKKELQFHDVTPGNPGSAPGLSADSAATGKSRKRPVENRVSRVNEKKKPMIRVRSNSVSALGDIQLSQKAPPRSEILQWQGELEGINLGYGFGGMDSNIFNNTNVPSRASRQYQQQLSQNSNDKYRTSNASSDFGAIMGLQNTQNTQNNLYNRNLNIGMDIRDSLGMNYEGGNAINSPINGILNSSIGGSDDRNQITRESLALKDMMGITNQTQPQNAMFQALPHQMNQMNLDGMNYDSLMSRQQPQQSAGPNVFVTPGTPLAPSNQSFDLGDPTNLNFPGQQQAGANGSKPELGRTGKTLSTVFREILSDQQFVPERKPQQQTNTQTQQQQQQRQQQQQQQQQQLNTQTNMGHLQNFNSAQNSPMPASNTQQLLGNNTNTAQLLSNTTFARPLNDGLEPLEGSSNRPRTQPQTQTNLGLGLDNIGLDNGLMNLGNTTNNGLNFKEGASSLPSVTGLRLPSDIMRVMDAEFGDLVESGVVSGVGVGVGGGGGGATGTRDSGQSTVETENDFLNFLDRESNALPRLPHR